MAIGEYDKAHFLAGQEFFDHQSRSWTKQLQDCLLGLFRGGGDYYSFSRRETVGFQDYWQAEFAQGVVSLFRGLCDRETGSGDSRAAHELLGEDFAAFQLGGGGSGADYGATLRAELIDDAGR